MGGFDRSCYFRQRSRLGQRPDASTGNSRDFVNTANGCQIPQSPPSVKRSSLPPLFNISHAPEAYKASPLQRALTPPPPDDVPEPFPSVESSLDSTTNSTQSGTNFHMRSTGLSNSDSSPMFAQPVQIYCANCRQLTVLKDSYACNECISGFCPNCVFSLSSDARNDGRPCPRCKTVGVRYKIFNLDLR